MDVLAVCHVHSEWSYDASWKLDALSAKFADAGYRVLLLTEHDRGFSEARLCELRKACADASSERLLVVPGIEYSDSANRVHVLVWGDGAFLGEQVPTGELLRRVALENRVAVLAHPSRRDVCGVFDPEWREGLVGIEVWNRKYDGWAPSERAGALLDASTVPFVGLDFHTERQSYPLAMVLDISADITEASVLDSIRNRRLQPSVFGVLLHGQFCQKALPVMGLAERARRTAASLVRSAARRR